MDVENCHSTFLLRYGSLAVMGLFITFALVALPLFSSGAYALDEADASDALSSDDDTIAGQVFVLGEDQDAEPSTADVIGGGEQQLESDTDAATGKTSEDASDENNKSDISSQDGQDGQDKPDGQKSQDAVDNDDLGGQTSKDADKNNGSSTADSGAAVVPEVTYNTSTNESVSTDKAASSSSATDTYTKVDEGVYSIVSALGKMLDVSSGGTTNGTNVQIYQNNYTPAQRFLIQAAGQSMSGEWYYTIKGVGSGKMIDVASSGTKNGTNVQIYQSNSTAAQQWYLRPYTTSDGKTYYRIINVGSNKALDVAGAENKNGTNVWIYQQNKTAAQDWALRLWTNLIPDGAYKIESKLNRNLVVEVKSSSGDDCAQVQINQTGSSLGQRFALNYNKKTGYYTITSYGSGKVIDVESANTANYTKIQQYGSNGTFAQWWQPVMNSDGSYTFYSALCGKVLDVNGANATAGNNIHFYKRNGTDAQKFYLTSTSPVFTGGTVRIQNGSNTYLVADVTAGLTQSGVALQLYANNGTRAQRYYISQNSDGTFAVREIKSGMYVTALSSGSVVQKTYDAGTDQAWYISATNNGHFALVSKSGLRLGAASAVKQGNALNAGSSAKGTSWNFVYVPIISNGLYALASSANSNLRLDVASASISNGANVQLYSSNGTNAQKFYIKHLGSNVYSIKNLWSGLAVDVASGNGKAGTNVQQYQWNGTNAQKWRAYWQDDGSIVFKSQLGEFALNVSSAKSGGNVNLSTYGVEMNQRFRLSETTAAKASMSEIIGVLDQLHTGGLTVYKSVNSLSSSTLNQLKSAINAYKNAGLRVGFVMTDLKTGATVAYNSDWQHYSASTIKGPYVAALLQYNPGALNQSRNALYNTINWSSNSDYASLRYRYGSGVLQNLNNQTHAGINCSKHYFDISATQLAKLWVGMASYFDGNSTGASWCRSTFGTNSYIASRGVTGGTVYAKSGWYYGGNIDTHSEACLVNNDGNPYVMSVVTNRGVYTDNTSSDSYMRTLMRALNKAHSELVSGL